MELTNKQKKMSRRFELLRKLHMLNIRDPKKRKGLTIQMEYLYIDISLSVARSISKQRK